MKRIGLVILAVAAVAASAFAADVKERRFIREGMAEGEVLFKIGKPDHESIIRSERGKPEEKAWTYFPDVGDRQTLTVITFHAGVVTKVERKISR